VLGMPSVANAARWQARKCRCPPRWWTPAAGGAN